MNVTTDCSRHGRNPSQGGSPWDAAALSGIAPDKHIKAELDVDAGADCLVIANKPARERTGRRIARDEDRAAQSDYRSPTLCCG
ncbi:hypothetical protein DPX16_19343 [Anabarilius grahami]|uniref:Uncharacterized protein n=1 Tax=Anabarilius grahami TaxID=495550 RepID=A0A3N0Z111_ANAGA|nr:hypothetical protein DPX16_19343 [Anabarilius grahami]